MTKVYIKLIAMSLALILSVSVVIMSSYAWLVLSGNPAATGIQVAIGGGNTILMAPNVKFTAEGKTYNIPGQFSDKMNFGQMEQYAYLQEVGNLTPVSTSNGIDWFMPTYYSGNDELVQQGRVPSGALRDISEFQVDSFLNHANQPQSEKNKIDEGNYIYLDFWVVAPGGDYFLRVSTGDGTEDGGSFVIDLLEPGKDEEGNNVLTQPRGSAAAAVRVGFLANDLMLTDETMEQYTESRYFDNRFTALRGIYAEPDTGASYNDWDRFTIYEPNGDYHPAKPELDGSYVETKSLEWKDGQIQENQQSYRNPNLTVQKKSTWDMADSTQTAIEQRYQTALVARLGEVLSEQDKGDLFYGKYLQGQISPYVNKGAFIKNMGNVISLLNSKGVVTAEQLNGEPVGAAGEGSIKTAGATDDVYIIKLERNVPQRVRMFIWLEGQDIDCVDSISSARFAVNIELAGGDQ